MQLDENKNNIFWQNLPNFKIKISRYLDNSSSYIPKKNYSKNSQHYAITLVKVRSHYADWLEAALLIGKSQS